MTLTLLDLAESARAAGAGVVTVSSQPPMTAGLNSTGGPGLLTSYSRMMEELRDPRVDSWLLMDSILPTLALSASYYLIVRHIGPWFMEKR